jgi:putative flippase GtrA
MTGTLVNTILAGRMALQRLLRTRFIRFLAIGAINTIFGYSIFALVFLASKSPTLAIVVATTIGVFFNFKTTGRFVFGNRRAATIVPFVMGYGVTMMLNIGLVDIALSLGIEALLAQGLTLPIVVITSYLINAKLVFARADDAYGL